MINTRQYGTFAATHVLMHVLMCMDMWVATGPVELIADAALHALFLYKNLERLGLFRFPAIGVIQQRY